MKYRKPNNQKLFLNFGKPFIKGFYNNQNVFKYNLNTNFINTKYYPKKNIQNIYTHINKYNNDITNKKNELTKISPIKYQYRKIPFKKVKGFKFKLPNNTNNTNNIKNILNLKQIKNKTNINYPIICEHNCSTIQSNMKDSLNAKEETINHQENIINKIKKPIYHQIIETSSIGSKYETREESAHFVRSKSSLNNIHLIKKEKEKEKNFIKDFSFLKFKRKKDKDSLSPDKKLLKYVNKAIKQLNKIKILITEQNTKKENLSAIKQKENLKNKNIRIDISKIGKNLEKYKNIIDIDKNKINLSYDRKSQTIGVNNDIDKYIIKKKRNKNVFKKLNKTIVYEDLKSNYKSGTKIFNINKRNKMEYLNKYNTINNEDKYKIRNYDTEIKIPKIDINYFKKIKNDKKLNLEKDEMKELDKKKRLIDRYKTENDGETIFYNDEKENNNNTDIANFEFSD